MVKNPPADAGAARDDMGSIPSWDDSLEEAMAVHSSILT